MSKYYAQDDIQLLANGAANCIVRNAAMPVTLRGGERPDGFPLPIKRVRGDGDITQDYRPLAILEWIQDVVSGEVARRATTAKKAKAAEQEQPCQP